MNELDSTNGRDRPCVQLCYRERLGPISTPSFDCGSDFGWRRFTGVPRSGPHSRSRRRIVGDFDDNHSAF